VILNSTDLASLGEGAILVSAIASNSAGSSSVATTTFTLDTIAPVTPAIALANDSGSSGSDGITNNGVVNISGLEISGGWQYSINAGVSWISGVGSSLTLSAGTYAAGILRVLQSDQAGNTSSAAQNTGIITIDLSPPTTTASITSVYEGIPGTAISNGGIANGSGTLVLNGSHTGILDAGDTVRVFDGSNYLGMATVAAGSNSWMYSDRRALALGQSVGYTARVVDIAGNQSAATGAYSIQQTSSLPVINLTSISLVEGAAGSTTQAKFHLSLSRASNLPIEVTYQFQNVSALEGEDYSAATGPQTLTFNPGVIALPVIFTVHGDGDTESDETLSLQLSNPKNATFTGGVTTSLSVSGTIINDDFVAIDPLQGITLTSSGNFNGAEKNDSLTGDAGNNAINGLAGDDSITGMGGADSLTGGVGADKFNYSALSESTLAATDFITDFNIAQGDRIDLPITVSALWNRGIITASSLQLALHSAFNDKDSATAGAQALAANEIVSFQWGTSPLRRNTYIGLSDGNSANFNGDLLIKLPNNPGPLTLTTFM